MNQDASTEVRRTTGFATFRWVALATVVVATVAGAFYYWRHVELYPTTENAYTGSNIVRVAPEVSGPVIRVYVRTDDAVKAGDPLFEIDPTLYDAALRNARAQFDAAREQQPQHRRPPVRRSCGRRRNRRGRSEEGGGHA